MQGLHLRSNNNTNNHPTQKNKILWENLLRAEFHNFYGKKIYNVSLEKDWDDIGSAVCYTVYTIYLSLCTQTADPISS